MGVGAEGQARGIGEPEDGGNPVASIRDHIPEDVVPLVIHHLGRASSRALLRLE